MIRRTGLMLVGGGVLVAILSVLPGGCKREEALPKGEAESRGGRTPTPTPTPTGPAAALGQDPNAVEKNIIEAWNKHKSMTAKMSLSGRMTIADSTVDQMGEGTYEFLRQDGKLLSRLELTSTTVQTTGTEETKVEEHLLAVSDGDLSQTLIELGNGEARVVKSKVLPSQSGDPKMLLDYLRHEGAVGSLPDDTVEGRKVYVIEVVLRESIPHAPVKERFAFDQETGFLLRIVGLGQNALPMTTMSYSDIKIDVPIGPERFQFTAPENAEVFDETTPQPVTIQPATASQPASAPSPKP